jgi:hypothetical protein
VGAAFLVLSGVLWWRGRLGAVPYVGALGAALVLAGLLVPTLLGPLHRFWTALSHALSRVTTPIFMGIVYFVILTPIALAMRLAGRRSLVHPLRSDGFWFDKTEADRAPKRMEHQF